MADPISRTYYRVSLEDGRQAALFHGTRRDSLLVQAGIHEQAASPMSPGYVELHAKSFYSFGVQGHPTSTSCWPRR